MNERNLAFSDHAERLTHYLLQASALRRAAKASPQQSTHKALKVWQAERLARSHAALHADERYRPAVDFFLTELYGPKDFSARDDEIARVVPVMVRFLPARALGTLADAVEMDALSESLDTDMVHALHALGRADRIDGAGYAAAYRRCGRADDRQLQIDLVGHIGTTLDHLTRLPLLRSTLRVMRKPAHMAGLATLQTFLETGFDAFRHMGSADEFLASILANETRYMEHLFNGGDG